MKPRSRHLGPLSLVLAATAIAAIVPWRLVTPVPAPVNRVSANDPARGPLVEAIYSRATREFSAGRPEQAVTMLRHARETVPLTPEEQRRITQLETRSRKRFSLQLVAVPQPSAAERKARSAAGPRAQPKP
jgi:regulator of extracellular matrix RemA (YlzA/DUF370 family)